MDSYSRTHLSDPDLLRNLAAKVARESAATADLLADLAEVDARKLYLPAAYPSMKAYCIHELHLPEEAAHKHIRVARAALRFPVIFLVLAEGHVHLSGLVMLATHLTPENVEELLAAATHKTCREIELLLAERFPRPDLPTRVEALSPQAELSPGTVEAAAERGGAGQLSSRTVEPPAPRPKVAPLSAERFALQTTIRRSTHESMRYAEALLGHPIPAEDLEEILDGAFLAYVAKLEKRKFAATSRPRRGAPRASADPRHIPAEVKRSVWVRDGGRCTFSSDSGRRCPATAPLDYDHIEPVARGGQATVENLRLRCWAHNQYEAERTFGAGFMSRKREEAQRARVQARAQKQAAADPEKDVTPWLRKLGFSISESRLAAEQCERIPDASLEDRVRFALRLLAPPHRTVYPTMAT